MKTLSWLASIILTLVIGALAFIHLSPEYDIYLVRSESMKGTINMGDMIVSAPVNNPFNITVKPGTIVTYKHGKGLITHRIKEVNWDIVVTKGDASEDIDPWKVRFSDIKGVYLFRIPAIGLFLSFVQTRQGWFLGIILPSILLLSLIVREIIKEAFANC
jgi:signal peptidase